VRHDGWTGEKQRGFVEALAKAGNVRDACRVVGMSKTSAYRLRRIDPAFGEKWDAAQKQAGTSLDAVAFARAVEGVEEVVFRDGKEHTRRRRYSDSILRLLLQASNPEKYGRTGGQLPVKAREEVEARVKEIEQRAYRAAWNALVAEYNYHAEPEYLRLWFAQKMAQMHQRLCGNALCSECHPERKGEGWHSLYKPEAHEPIDGPAVWRSELDRQLFEERMRHAVEGRWLLLKDPVKIRKVGDGPPPPPPCWAGSEAEETG
jgi:hypothetical protein